MTVFGIIFKKGVRICDRNIPADPQISKEGTGEGAVGARADSSAAHGADHGEGAVSSMSKRVHGDAEIYLQPMEEPHIRADGCPKEAVTLWKTYAGTGSWQDLDL